MVYLYHCTSAYLLYYVCRSVKRSLVSSCQKLLKHYKTHSGTQLHRLHINEGYFGLRNSKRRSMGEATRMVTGASFGKNTLASF